MYSIRRSLGIHRHRKCDGPPDVDLVITAPFLEPSVATWERGTDAPLVRRTRRSSRPHTCCWRRESRRLAFCGGGLHRIRMASGQSPVVLAAVRAVPVATGTSHPVLVAAAFALVLNVAELAGSAPRDRANHSAVAQRHVIAELLEVCRCVLPKAVRWRWAWRCA